MMRSRWVLWGLGFLGALLAAAAAVALSFPPVRSAITHLGGSPTESWALESYAPGPGPEVRLAVAGDVGYPGSREEATAAAMLTAGWSRPFDALVLLGDNVYPNGDPERLDETVFEPFGPVLSGGAELWPILGNHDVMDGNAEGQVERLGMPGRWYSERMGPVLFVALDSTDLEAPGQLEWLEETLANTTAPWRIVALHHPPYSSGYQGSDLHARALVSPIVERYGVQLVLSGHEHDYERSWPLDDVTYVVSGAAADTRRTGKEDFTAEAWSWHHFLVVDVYEDHLDIQAVNQDDRVFDEVSIEQSP